MAIPLFLYFLNYTIGRKLLSDIMMGIKPRTSIAGATAHPFGPKPLPWWQFFVSDKKISSKKDYFSSFQSDQAWSVTSELFDDSLFVVFLVIKLSRWINRNDHHIWPGNNPMNTCELVNEKFSFYSLKIVIQ